MDIAPLVCCIGGNALPPGRRRGRRGCAGRGPGRSDHTLLLYADSEDRAAEFDEVAAAAERRAYGMLNACAVLAPEVRAQGLLPTVHDSLGEFRQMYGARGGEAILVRPDGYLGLRTTPASGPQLHAHLDAVFRP